MTTEAQVECEVRFRRQRTFYTRVNIETKKSDRMRTGTRDSVYIKKHKVLSAKECFE
jgi:hypothetical protein